MIYNASGLLYRISSSNVNYNITRFNVESYVSSTEYKQLNGGEHFS